MATTTRIRFNHELLGPRENVMQLGALARASGAQTMQALIHFYLGNVSDGPGTMLTPRVLFVDTENSARSQMAEALLRKHAGALFEVYSAGVDAHAGAGFEAHSAGIDPCEINPLTVRVMNEIGIDASGQWAKSVELFRGRMHFDYLITVCSNAEERCPVFPAVTARLHWPFDDPATPSGSEEERLARFRAVRDEIEKRILAWLQEVQ